jgi:RNA polymerase sigma factor (sigma-70 family)
LAAGTVRRPRDEAEWRILEPTMDAPALQRLIERARSGDPVAWARLFELSQPHLLSDAQRLLGHDWAWISPRDLTQETWLKARRAIGSYRGAGFHAWLSSIMRNVHRNLIRGRRGRHERRLLPLPGPLEAEERSPSVAAIEPMANDTNALATVLQRETSVRIQTALAGLDPEPRRIVELSLQGLSFRQIGQQLSLSPKEVRTRYHRGLAELRRQLKEASS